MLLVDEFENGLAELFWDYFVPELPPMVEDGAMVIRPLGGNRWQGIYTSEALSESNRATIELRRIPRHPALALYFQWSYSNPSCQVTFLVQDGILEARGSSADPKLEHFDHDLVHHLRFTDDGIHLLFEQVVDGTWTVLHEVPRCSGTPGTLSIFVAPTEGESAEAEAVELGAFELCSLATSPAEHAHGPRRAAWSRG